MNLSDLENIWEMIPKYDNQSENYILDNITENEIIKLNQGIHYL